jgi:hypothetical protein
LSQNQKGKSKFGEFFSPRLAGKRKGLAKKKGRLNKPFRPLAESVPQIRAQGKSQNFGLGGKIKFGLPGFWVLVEVGGIRKFDQNSKKFLGR